MTGKFLIYNDKDHDKIIAKLLKLLRKENVKSIGLSWDFVKNEVTQEACIVTIITYRS